MSQSFNKLPSEIFNVQGAAGLCFDRGIFLFGNYVEGEMSSAESRASNSMFARSARARAFARCMGDDMETSTAGYADPAAVGEKILGQEKATDQVLWTEKSA